MAGVVGSETDSCVPGNKDSPILNIECGTYTNFWDVYGVWIYLGVASLIICCCGGCLCCCWCICRSSKRKPKASRMINVNQKPAIEMVGQPQPQLAMYPQQVMMAQPNQPMVMTQPNQPMMMAQPVMMQNDGQMTGPAAVTATQQKC
eukprot:TRINITY_DN680815_c0_g1_i1.p2 TRINITY_DN680815_c0_g1~~TRINITY_DN680815_c0_g1_i1.p2  ORF type:complete len:147 (-),score=42.55 TRINITY_DN680815_c0_g1_i1:973-1413(-)